MGKIISTHSFRGGTGKSNITANLASDLAIAGKRIAIIDTDIQSPGIHVLFGLDADTMRHTLNEYLRGEAAVEDVALNIGDSVDDVPGRSQLRGKSIWLVPSSINSQEISRVLREGYDVNTLNKGIQTLRKKLALDYLLIDTHPGLSDETLLSIAISDTLLLVLRPDQQDFQGTAVTVDVARSLDIPDLKIVVNKALSKYDHNQIAQQVEDQYQAPVVGVLPLTEDMAEMASRDIFTLRYPDHPWSLAMRDVTQKLLEAS
jgi:MinD-like ATPase involved in chromosome partitioning or flagellar assembly